jgi:DNA-binding protein H-NS
MEKDLEELENLKKRLLNKNKPSEDDIIFELRAVMREVGGYTELMNLPTSAYEVILESIAKEKEREEREYKKMKSRKR